MSINWVMTANDGESFIKLPNERILYTSPSRTSLQISTPNTFPGAQPFTAKSDSGITYVTNQRIVYLPTAPTPELQSFSSPILNLEDTHVRAPFFGANYWTALCKPVNEGGIPPQHPVVEVRLTFKDGGAFDFHTMFEQIKERVHQAYTIARENGQASLGDIHLEQLPAYEPASDLGGRVVEEDEPVILSPVPIRPGTGPSSPLLPPSAHSQVQPPDESPPGYEEAQAHAVREQGQ